MSQIIAVIKEKIDKIYILKGNRILIYEKDKQSSLCNESNYFYERDYIGIKK